MLEIIEYSTHQVTGKQTIRYQGKGSTIYRDWRK